MPLEIAGWLVDAGTEHARMTIGPKFPMGHYSEALVTMIDANNATFLAVRESENKENERWKNWCLKESENKLKCYVATQNNKYLAEAEMLQWAARECGCKKEIPAKETGLPDN